MFKNRIKEIKVVSQLKRENGNVSLLVLLLMVVLLSSAGVAVDVGRIVIERAKLSNALDYAALAGAQELPDDPDAARTVAVAYLNDNNIDPTNISIVITDDHKTIALNGTKEMEFSFIRVLGFDKTNVTGSSKVILGAVKSVKGGLRPFAVEDFDYAYGTVITLKQEGGDGYHGNYGVVALGATGSGNYELNALYGYKGEVAIGDEILTEPGNMANVSNALKDYINNIPDTFDNFSRDSDRLWTVPLVDTLEENGRGAVVVTGFAEVFVEDIQKRSGKIEINARFIRFVVNGEIDQTVEDRGTYGIKLVN